MRDIEVFLENAHEPYIVLCFSEHARFNLEISSLSFIGYTVMSSFTGEPNKLGGVAILVNAVQGKI